jgi:hypothetical protein
MSNSPLGRPQIGGGGFVDQLMDDRLALGDLAPFSVDRDEDLLIQRIGEQRMQLLFAAAAGVTGLPLAETSVQRRAAGAHLVIVVVIRHMRLPLLRRSGSVDYRNASGVANEHFLSDSGGIVNMAQLS